MEDLIESLTRGNVAEVKVVIASAIVALGAYQLLLAAVAYGRVRPPFLGSAAASWTHRASGDAIVVLVLLVAVACVSSYGFAEGGLHTVLGSAATVAVALKVGAVRAGGRVGRLLPAIGASLFVLLAAAWLSSAGDFLGLT